MKFSFFFNRAGASGLEPEDEHRIDLRQLTNVPQEKPALCSASIKSRMRCGSRGSGSVAYPSQSVPSSQNFTPIARIAVTSTATLIRSQ
jgi:hypothetical protein